MTALSTRAPAFTDMRGAAAFAGLSYDRFKKVWRALVRTKGFPAPYLDTPYRWAVDRLTAWRDASAEARRAQLLAQVQPANDDGAPEPPVHRRTRVAAGRARIIDRMRKHA